MQHVLIIGKVWPEPKSSAAGLRTMQFINLFLAQGWAVSFACAASESEFAFDIERVGVRKFKIELNDSGFDEFIKELQPTVVVFDRFTLEEQFGWRVAECCPNALRIIDTIDLHCLRLARQQALKEARVFTKGDLFSDVAKREIASIYRCDLAIMISDFEMDLLQSYFKIDKQLLHYTPFLFEALSGAQKQNLPSFSERNHFVSIGNFLHEPNWDAVLFLKHHIWPLIRKQLPKVELHIYGAYPSEKVFQLHNAKEGFLVKGRAERAEEIMKQARVCLAPLRFGAGIKGKLTDSMQNGTPNVTTGIGAEGMHGKLPWNGFVEDDPQAFSDAAVKLYQDEIIWEQFQQNGFTIISDFFSRQVHSEKLIEVILDTYTNLEQHRKTNFIGSMLMHHTAMGTKYMAKWIEAKNKLKEA